MYCKQAIELHDEMKEQTRQHRRSSTMGEPIRAAYERLGIQDYYQRFGAAYRNPHEHAIQTALRQALLRWPCDLSAVLDLACGSGEVTLALQAAGCASVDGIDPYTERAYRQRTGKVAQPYTFAEIASGALAGRRYSLIVCSFALHLVEGSRLPILAYQLSRIGQALLVLTPHKRPVLRPEWGWTLRDELVVERVRVRYYVTTYPHPLA
ncbi:MAG TPA: class I SAM-dependent methyltransferase [Chloroflexota bacterium]|nr:class I SAM-dependent methyltransferase [Chloroflexota bacterium]